MVVVILSQFLVKIWTVFNPSSPWQDETRNIYVQQSSYLNCLKVFGYLDLTFSLGSEKRWLEEGTLKRFKTGALPLLGEMRNRYCSISGQTVLRFRMRIIDIDYSSTSVGARIQVRMKILCISMWDHPQQQKMSHMDDSGKRNHSSGQFRIWMRHPIGQQEYTYNTYLCRERDYRYALILQKGLQPIITSILCYWMGLRPRS